MTYGGGQGVLPSAPGDECGVGVKRGLLWARVQGGRGVQVCGRRYRECRSLHKRLASAFPSVQFPPVATRLFSSSESSRCRTPLHFIRTPLQFIRTPLQFIRTPLQFTPLQFIRVFQVPNRARATTARRCTAHVQRTGLGILSPAASSLHLSPAASSAHLSPAALSVHLSPAASSVHLSPAP